MSAGGDIPRVLLVGGAIEGGGAERRLSLLADHMFGGDVDVAVLKAPSRPRPRTFDLGWSGKLTYATAMWRLRSLVRAGGYDVILAISLYPAALSKAAIGLAGRRVALISNENSRPEKYEEEWKRHFRSSVSKRLSRWAYGRSELFVANSEDGLNESIRLYGVRAERTARVPNLLPLDQLAREAAEPAPELEGEPEGVLRLCAVSRLVGMKRMDTVLAAAAQLPADVPWRLWILGDGPERAALARLAQELGVAQNVRFFGWMANPSRLVARADVYVHASMYEGFSNAVIEAMAVGTPVVTSFCSSDARDMARRGAAAGFEPGDVEGLRDAIVNLARDPSARAALKSRAETYVQPLRPEVAIKVYEDLALRAAELRRGA